eukprot:1157706-Pelagomonas_calceolata.AAC.9
MEKDLYLMMEREEDYGERPATSICFPVLVNWLHDMVLLCTLAALDGPAVSLQPCIASPGACSCNQTSTLDGEYTLHAVAYLQGQALALGSVHIAPQALDFVNVVFHLIELQSYYPRANISKVIARSPKILLQSSKQVEEDALEEAYIVTLPIAPRSCFDLVSKWRRMHWRCVDLVLSQREEIQALVGGSHCKIACSPKILLQTCRQVEKDALEIKSSVSAAAVDVSVRLSPKPNQVLQASGVISNTKPSPPSKWGRVVLEVGYSLVLFMSGALEGGAGGELPPCVQALVAGRLPDLDAIIEVVPDLLKPAQMQLSLSNLKRWVPAQHKAQ